MDHNEAERKIGALKAIIQAMMPEYYLMQSGGLPKEDFLESLEKDEPIAMAISNEFTESEIEDAFDWTKMASEGGEAELRATPVTPFLNADQVGKLRRQLANMDRNDASSEEGVRGPGRACPARHER